MTSTQIIYVTDTFSIEDSDDARYEYDEMGVDSFKDFEYYHQKQMSVIFENIILLYANYLIHSSTLNAANHMVKWNTMGLSLV